MMYKDLGEKIFAANQYNKEREYWLNKLSGEWVRTGFPPDTVLGTPSITDREIDTLSFQFPPVLFERLLEIINNSDSRLHIALVTGLTLLLYKYTGNLDIIIGTPIDRQDIEGEFINTILPLRSRIDEQMSLKEFLKQVKQTVIEASENQNYPIETIPHELGLPAIESGGDFPLFTVAVLLRNIQDKQYIEHINLNMLFSFLRTKESLEGIVEYNAAIFEKRTVQRIVSHFLHLIYEAFSQVDLKLVDVPVLTEEERNSIVVDFNNTAADYPQTKMIHQLFEEQAIRTPNNIAVQTVSQQMTYRELNRKANRLAYLLREKGIGNETVAAIMLESSIEVPLAILAILKAGGAYLPMGFEYPDERIDYMLTNSRAKVLLTRKSLVEGKNITCPILCLDDETIYTGKNENLEPVNNAGSLVYVIYTSGTTGQPKGVMIEHRGLVNYIWWASRMYVNNEKLDFPLYTSISFDLTVTSIFTPLITGNTIIVYGGVDKKLYIEDVIDDNRVGIVKLTPSHLKLLRSKIVKNSSIKCLIVGGEELETNLVKEIYNNFDCKIEIYNEYGPTETVVGSVIYRFDPGHDSRYSVPIGMPIANTLVFLLNNHHQPVPIGVVGELYIGGDGLARGYLYNPGMTEEKFVPNPLIPGKKIYKTGDLAVRLPDGNIEYKSRIDHQVKIRGYRVETGEIEAKIVEFQKMSHAGREQKKNIVEKLDLKSLQYCKSCLIPANYPGGIHFDEQGICDICREFETYKDKALAYFKTINDFHKEVERAQKTKKSKYDCLMLYSGGKDSSYTLHRLVEMNLQVLAFTFDNGYISEKAFENIDRTTKLLKVDHIMLDSQAMKEIFVESLWSDYNVCNGCFKAVNTLGTKIAHDHRINLVISGLTRGQIFDIKLHGLFKLGVFDEDTIEERLSLFRKNYHSMTHRTSRLIGVEISGETLDNTYFVDYFRYDNIPTSEIFEYLKEKDKGWIRPTDTGASSSNCIINDVGIYVHLKDKGCHFYAPQLSWDCRLGTITREEGLEEMWGYTVDYPMTHRVLNEIGYYDAFAGAVVTDAKDEKGEKTLCAYILADKEFDVSDLRTYLSRELPDYMIPTYFTRIDRIPLTASGKIDRSALPKFELTIKEDYVAPRNPVEERLVDVWSELLGLRKEKIGIDVNFFEVGGHSLRATFLAASINKEFNVRVPLVKIFERPTIRAMAEYIAEASEETFTAIPVAKEKEYYVLSSAQKRLYILQQIDFKSTAYNVNLSVELDGETDRVKLEDAFIKLLARHEGLRTSFEMVAGTPVQRIHSPGEIEFKVEYLDISGPRFGGDNSIPSPAEIIDRFIQPFDLSQAPLLRVGLIRTQPMQHVLMVDLHHIITDGISHGILVKDFLSLYSNIPLPALKLQYKDYSEWQQSTAIKDAVKKQEEFWLQQFDGEIPVLNTPTDYPRPVVQSFEGSVIDFQLSITETKALNTLARSQGATLFMVLLATYSIFLSKLSRQQEIIVGTPVAGRRHSDLEQIIGVFINILALKNHPEEETTFFQFLNSLRENTLAAFDNQDYHFEDLVEKISVERDMARSPLFDVMFILQNMFDPSGNVTEKETQNVKVKPYAYKAKMSKFDLSLIAAEVDEQLNFTFEYCSRLFREDTILGFIKYFRQIVSSIIETPAKKIKEIEIISEEEKKRVLSDFNHTMASYPVDKTIPELFVEQAEKAGDRIAIIGMGQGALTYSELNEKSNRFAYLLQVKGVQPGTISALMVERTLEMIIAIFGILKAGGAYLPISPDYPEERIKYMLKDSGAGVLVAMGALVREDKKLGIWEGEICYIEELMRLSHPFTFLTSYLQNSSNLAYVIYTSGTTGRPKGVVVEHRSLVNRLNWMQKKYPIDKTDTILNKTSFTFDVSVWEIFWWALTGAKVCLLIPGGEKDPGIMIHTIEKNHITTVHFVPSMLGVFLDYVKERGEGKKLSSLKQVIASGEALTISHVKQFDELLHKENGVRLANLYGPTEATIDVSYFNCFDTDEIETIPIGKPIDNTQLYILDAYLHPQPVGISGELHIAGQCLARGYLNRLELTAEKFIKLNWSYRSNRTYILYKTGDLARWQPDGNIQFLGRIDSQVKIRGFRIEPGEIERRLTEIKAIKEAVVIDREAPDQGKYLCAYFVAEEDVPVSVLETTLSKALPEYMMPTYFVRLEKIPLTLNGKIDRNALLEPEKKANDDSVFTFPRNERDEKLAKIWSEILGMEEDSISIDGNFFRLGGHSLTATVMTSRIHKEFNVRLSLADVFKNPTVRKISEYIKNAVKEQYKPITPVEKMDVYDLSHAQRRLWVLESFEKASTAYIMKNWYVFENLNTTAFEKAIETLVRRHEILRTVFPLVNQEPKQKINDFETSGFKIQYVDLREENKHEKSIEKIIAEEGNTPFNLEKGPLLRAKLLRIAKNSWLLVFTMHHIISDAWSMQILINEVITLYKAYCRGNENPLPELHIQYKDFAAWHNRFLKGEELTPHRDYWLNRFKGEIPVLNLETDFPRPKIKTYAGRSITFELDREIVEGLEFLSRDMDSTLLMILAASVVALLHRYSGQEDIVIGLPISGREQIDLENQVGFYLNILPLRTIFGATDTIEDFLVRVKNAVMELLDHQAYPFDLLLDELRLDRDQRRSPLFDVIVQFLNFERTGIETGIEGENEIPGEQNISIDNSTSKYDLVFNFSETGKRIYTEINFNTALFEQESILIMAEKLKSVLCGIKKLGVRLDDLNIEIEIEKRIKNAVEPRSFDFEEV